MTLASFLSTGTQHAILNGLAFFAFVLWLCLGFWTYKDAKRRIEDPLLIGMSVVLALVIPYLGPFVYMLFRPPEYLDDVRERDLEIKAIERRLGGSDLRCPVCRAEVEEDFLVCPVCTTKLRQSCSNCHRPLEALWQVCPYCETPIEHDPASTAALSAARRPPRQQRSR